MPTSLSDAVDLLPRNERSQLKQEVTKGADYLVSVTWEAVPYTENYYRLPENDRLEVNRLFALEVDALIPPQQRQGWQNLFVGDADYDSILTHMNSMLEAQVVPPPNKKLTLSRPEEVFWRPTPAGHLILSFAGLREASGQTVPWEVSVTFNDMVIGARMGISYECALV